MRLSQARYECSRNLMRLEVWLDQWCLDQGYAWARGEGADFVTAKDPSTDHMHPGLHGFGLAQDYVLYEILPDGSFDYLTDSEEYRAMNEYWKSLHPFCRAGIDFPRVDGNHVSFSDHSIPGCTAPNGDLRK